MRTSNDDKIWNEEQIAELIFTSGITTSDKVDKVSSRGVSMDGVKHRLQQHHGEIYLHFDKDKFCEFEITLPAEWWNVNLLFCF